LNQRRASLIPLRITISAGVRLTPHHNRNLKWRIAMSIFRVLCLAVALATAVSPAFAAEPQTVEVLLGSYYIKPDKITVKVGQPVTLKLTNEATIVPHNFVIHAPAAGIDVKLDVPAGKKASVSFTPTKVGTYEMACNKKLLFFASHKDKGMHGVLTVVE
jgi:heme/copper-type cytochrome/quinol oxidase subunit 2